jgi:spore cortex biosynthesis protein YabQ
MLIGFIYDLFRIKRKAIKTGTVITYLEDFFYWILVSLIMFSVVYYSNDGEIRGYNFIGTILGIVLYSLLLSKIVINSSMFVIRVICRVFTTVWRILIFPFKVLMKALAVPGRFLAKKTTLACKKARRSGRTMLSKANIWHRIFRNSRKKI